LMAAWRQESRRGGDDVARRSLPAADQCRPAVLALLNQQASVAGEEPKSSPSERCAELNCAQYRSILITIARRPRPSAGTPLRCCCLPH
jgi:hypothetical protein